jgi:hypothetical protein
MRFPALVISVIAVAFVAMLLSASFVSAGPGPKTVRGYIKDNMGNPVEGASVLVEIVAPDSHVRTSGTDTSISNGLYSVMFGPFDWELGDTLRVTSTYNSDSRVGSAVANSTPIQYVNITYPYEIPQFGSWAGFAVAGGILAVVAVVFVGKRKKNSPE